MFLGALIVGSIAGYVAFFAVLILGYSLGAAIAALMLVGMVATVLLALGHRLVFAVRNHDERRPASP